jgi:glucokinase
MMRRTIVAAAQNSKLKTLNYLGIDLGGSKIAAAVVDVASGALAGRIVVPTEAHEGPDAVVARMAELALEVCRAAGLRPEQLGGLGVGVPGVFDLATGRTLFLPTLPTTWSNVPVGEALRRALGLPVWLINDARAFVLAEASYGAGRDARTVVGLTLGTGIGGGIALDGRLHLGLDGTAGEVGHMTIDPHGRPCGCGNHGCLETFASGPAITTLGIGAVVNGRTTRIGELAGHDLNRVTPETVMRAAEAGDEVAREILARAGAALGVGVANLVTILSPDRVILGGSVARLGEWLFGPVREAVRQRVRAVPVERVAILPATLGGDAGVIGAAVWASQRRNEER